jgi:(2Fe-2S) ferredoxin
VEPDRVRLAEIAARFRVGGFHRHVFFCVGGACAPDEEGTAAWEALKKEFKDRNLTPGTAEYSCYRTKVGCLRICQDGPIAVVYPEGTWYCRLTADRIPEFVQKHIVEGQPIEDWIFARNPLPLPVVSPSDPST